MSLSYLFACHVRPVSIRTRKSMAVASGNTESLEARQLMSVSTGADGYTDVSPSSDSHVIYVSSSSGSDSNSGSQSSPVKSVSKGISLMRSGMPDEVLLKRGDSWSENLSFGKSGRSASEPALLGAYGSGARPTIKAGSGTALDISAGWVNNVVIQGIHFYSDTRDPDGGHFSRSAGSYGIRFVAGTTSALVEDCQIDEFRFNVLFQAFNNPQSNVKLKRNIITDAYGLNAASAGIYGQGVNGLTLQENVFDHNGWNEKVSGAGAIPLSHNAYLSELNNNVTVTGNVFANAASHGLQTRAGGNVTDNLFLNNPIGMSYGLVNGASLKAGGVTGTVSGNVFMGSRDLAGSPRGWAIQAGNIKSATISNNIMTDDGGSGAAGAISLETGGNLENASQGVGINNLTIQNNIINKWYMAMEMSGSLVMGGGGYTGVHNLVVRDNDFQNVDSPYDRIIAHSGSLDTGDEHWSNNTYYDNGDSSKWFTQGAGILSLSTWKSRLEPSAVASHVNYSNPNASISGYAGSYGAFMSGAEKMAQGSYNSFYTAKGAINYVRGAFNQSTSPTPTPTPAPTPTPTPTPSPSPTSTPPVTVKTDKTPPTVKFKGTDAAWIWLWFSEPVGASLSASDISIKNTKTGAAVTGISFRYEPDKNTGVWWWPSYNGGKLAKGTYKATIAKGNVKDAAGNPMAADYSLTFTV